MWEPIVYTGSYIYTPSIEQQYISSLSHHPSLQRAPDKCIKLHNEHTLNYAYASLYALVH